MSHGLNVDAGQVVRHHATLEHHHATEVPYSSAETYANTDYSLLLLILGRRNWCDWNDDHVCWRGADVEPELKLVSQVLNGE